MGPPPTADAGRVRIVGRVGVAMVLTMVSRPPEGAFLIGAATEPGEHKLKRPAGIEGTMRQIAVVADGDADHAQQITGAAQHQRHRGRAREEDGQAGQVQPDEARDSNPVGESGFQLG